MLCSVNLYKPEFGTPVVVFPEIYLSILMILGTVTTLLSIWVLNLYNKDENQRISLCLQKFTDYVIAPITCMSCRKKICVDEDITGLKQIDKDIGNCDKDKTRRYERSHSMLPSAEIALGRRQGGRMLCRDFAIVLDIFLFRVAFFSLVVLTLTVIIVLES